jgi:SOS-response transcriptional repressor LexA
MANKFGEVKHSRQAVYDYIVKFKKENDGNSPTVREIMQACNIPSSSNTSYILNQLSEAGLIEITEGLSRGIMVVGGSWSLEDNHAIC